MVGPSPYLGEDPAREGLGYSLDPTSLTSSVPGMELVHPPYLTCLSTPYPLCLPPDLVIRSHEVKQDGYDVAHAGEAFHSEESVSLSSRLLITGGYGLQSSLYCLICLFP